MTTAEFITILEQYPELPLAFEYKKGAFVRADYHITEIKNISYDTVDCGGIANQWQEVHVQLWESPLPQPQHAVNTTKALKIYQTVEKVRPTLQDVEMKFEYSNAHFHKAILPIGKVDIHENQIIVKLGEEFTTCKAIDRASTEEEKAAACCGPAEVVEVIQKPKVNLSDLVVSNASCKPGSGCC